MIGYPNGLWDEKHNLLIFRSGIAASHPAMVENGLPGELYKYRGYVESGINTSVIEMLKIH